MEVNGIPIVDPPTGSSRSAASLAENFDNFLTLLTTQLQHQDPLSPLDTTEFTNQLTQFAQVEQSINTNNKLDRLIDLNGGNLVTTGVAYIGKTVEAAGDTLPLQDGSGQIGYELAGAAARTTITILNENGSLVRSLEGSTEAGHHVFTWDGRDDAGNQRTDGLYKVLVTALDAEDRNIEITTTTFGRVTGVEADSGAVTLNLGGLRVPLESVRSVNESI